MIVNLVDDAQYQSTNSKITEDISILYLIYTQRKKLFCIYLLVYLMIKVVLNRCFHSEIENKSRFFLDKIILLLVVWVKIHDYSLNVNRLQVIENLFANINNLILKKKISFKHDSDKNRMNICLFIKK